MLRNLTCANPSTTIRFSAQKSPILPPWRNCLLRKISNLETQSDHGNVPDDRNTVKYCYSKASGVVRGSKWPISECIARNQSRSTDDASSEATSAQTSEAQLPFKRKTASLLENESEQSQSTKSAMRVKDDIHVKTGQAPTASDYPHMTPDLFQRPKVAFFNVLEKLVTFRSQFSWLAHVGYRCFLSFKGPKREQVVMGMGSSQENAEHAAYLRLVTKFHEDGVLAEVFNPNSDDYPNARVKAVEDRDAIIDDSSNAQVEAVEDRDAIIDVYNYAAKFDLVLSVQAKKGARLERRGRNCIRVTLALPEKGIKAIGLGSSFGDAEARAAATFKKEAEKLQVEAGTGNLNPKDDTALTTDTCVTFLQFLEIAQPHLAVTTHFPENKYPFATARYANACQVMINGQLMDSTFTSSTKSNAKLFALLSTSIELKKSFPELFSEFLNALRKGNGKILNPIKPIHADVTDDIVLLMQDTLRSARKQGLRDSAEDVIADMSVIHDQGHDLRGPRASHLTQLSIFLQKNLIRFRRDPFFQELRKAKGLLPMNQYRSKVLEIVNRNPYSIIIGATGSGKTTQLPQILLEDMIDARQGSACNIICTQPRRIAAISVSQRVAYEKGEKLQQSVGYQIRGDNKSAPLGGSITYCTTGILLAQLKNGADTLFDTVSHIVLDEVHERDILIDFLLVLLKRTISRRKSEGKPVPRLVLMSATMDPESFANYLQVASADGTALKCPVLNVPGRAFPVQQKFLDEIIDEMSNAGSPYKNATVPPDEKNYLDSEKTFVNTTTTSGAPVQVDQSVIDWRRERKHSTEGEIIVDDKVGSIVPLQLIAHTVAHIVRSTNAGAILVFLPGMCEILTLEALLQRDRELGIDFCDADKFKLYKLHSAIADAQTAVFGEIPAGCRKIILSTNIAETSVTIPDVQYVVDSGKVRQDQYNQTRRITSLTCTWISKSNVKQRAGRAGRVQKGNYYALYSKERYNSFRPAELPEMLRSDLQEVCLDVKAQEFDTPVREFLAEAIDSPPPKAVDIAVVNLQKLDALTDMEEITPLGRLLAHLPVHPNLGKMIVLGIIFRCLDPILILGSLDKSLFRNPAETHREAHRARVAFVEGTGSDHIALIHAVRELRRVRVQEDEHVVRSFAYHNFLDLGVFQRMESTAQQIEDRLVDAGLIPYTPPDRRRLGEFGSPAINENSQKVPLIKGLILAGFHPNLAVGGWGPVFRTVSEKRTMLHPSSINARDVDKPSYQKRKIRHKPGKLFTYSTMNLSLDGRTLYLRETTESTPLQAALFGGEVKYSPEQPNVIEIDDWLPFHLRCSSPKVGQTVRQTVVEFRKALDRMLISAFRGLGKSAQSIKAGRAPETYLADDEVRSTFASGVVEVLDRERNFHEETMTRGWGGPSREVDFVSVKRDAIT